MSAVNALKYAAAEAIEGDAGGGMLVCVSEFLILIEIKVL